MATIALLAYLVLHMVLLQRLLLAHIRAVGKQWLALVRFLNNDTSRILLFDNQYFIYF